MKKKIIFILPIILILLIIYWIIGTKIIANENIKVIKDKIPNFYKRKKKIKNTLFFKKNDALKKVIIKTDGLKTFELSEDNKIYIFTHQDKKMDLKIEGVLEDRKINCLNKTFVKDEIIDINLFSLNCKNAVYYIGKIEDSFKDNFYFTFGLKQKINKSKNLLVLPTTAFYNYSSNIFGINVYSTKNNEYITQLSEIPLNNTINWNYKIANSIHNLKNVFNEFDIVNDYNFENMSLENYNLIILPLHQEYISKPFFNKLLNFIELKENNILSIGASNFSREVFFKKNLIIYKNNKFWKNQNSYGLSFFYDTNNYNFTLGCKFLNDKKINLGYVSQPTFVRKADYFFYEIVCKNNKKIPLLSTQTFSEGGGKLIQIFSDGIGLNFHKIEHLKLEILNQIN